MFGLIGLILVAAAAVLILMNVSPAFHDFVTHKWTVVIAALAGAVAWVAHLGGLIN